MQLIPNLKSNQLKKKNFVIFAVCMGLLFLPLLNLNAQVQVPESVQKQSALELELQKIEEEIAIFQNQLNQTKAEKNTLQNKINQLKKQQEVLNLQIQASNLAIADMDFKLKIAEEALEKNLLEQKRSQSDLAEILRAIYEKEDKPLAMVLVSSPKLSDAVAEIDSYEKLSFSLTEILKKLSAQKKSLENTQAELMAAQEEQQNLIAVRELQKLGLGQKVGEQDVLLQQTKGKEKDYQIVLSDTKRRASEIRGRIYELLGVSQAVNFGEALEIANWVSGRTGVRAAFLLAILTQESNLGKNVGTCNRPGDPPEKNWRVVMKPERDQEPFLLITSELGLNPDVTPVSCPMKNKDGSQLGWGGAMGPAQFIPSTWMGYKDKVAELTGKSPANPWDIRDAFAAAAIKLKAGGADNTLEGEWKAAMRYFSGGLNTKYRFYGDNVNSLTEKYLADIAELE